MDDIEKPGERDRRFATAAVTWALRELTANLLRVVRGAGKSYEIFSQIDAVMTALAEYHAVFKLRWAATN